jgi:transcriptional regulator
MYTPKHFQNNDTAEVKEFIRHNGFGILVTQGRRLQATHIPMMLSGDGTRLMGHISRGNKQGQDFIDGSEVLAIFNGPHSYISSSWYNHENVPTWNYVAVHVYGVIRVLEGDALRESLKELVDKYEKHSAHPVSLEGMSPGYVEREMRGITGFEITITNIEASYKLSQNRDDVNHQAIIQELIKRDDPDSTAIASLMREHRR